MLQVDYWVRSFKILGSLALAIFMVYRAYYYIARPDDLLPAAMCILFAFFIFVTGLALGLQQREVEYE